MKEYIKKHKINPRENPMTGKSYIGYDENNKLIFLRTRALAPTWPFLWPIYYIIRKQYLQLLVSVIIYLPLFGLIYYLNGRAKVFAVIFFIAYLMYTTVFNNKISGYFYTKKMKRFVETKLKLRILDKDTELKNVNDLTIVNCYYYESREDVLFYENEECYEIDVYCSQYNDENIRKIAEYIHLTNYKYLRLNFESNQKIPDSRYSNLFLKNMSNGYERIINFLLNRLENNEFKSKNLTRKEHAKILKYLSWHLFLLDNEIENEKFIVLDDIEDYNQMVLLNQLHGITKPIDYIFSFDQIWSRREVFIEDYYFKDEELKTLNNENIMPEINKINVHLKLNKDMLSRMGYRTNLFINGELESNFNDDNNIIVETTNDVELRLVGLFKSKSQKFQLEPKMYELNIQFNYYKLFFYTLFGILVVFYGAIKEGDNIFSIFTLFCIIIVVVSVIYICIKDRKIKIKEKSE